MQRYNILWADDEIDVLKPHMIFLEEKGYQVTPVVSGIDALEKLGETNFDLIFLDENMPGMSGLETLTKIKEQKPAIPVVMITKSEEESIMEEAIGSKITDYLIKPINPKQVLLSIKKILDNKRLVTEKTNMGYQQDFRNLSMTYNDIIDYQEWVEVYKKLIYWEIEIDNTEFKSMKEVLEAQKSEANANFCRFIEDHYESWVNKEEDGPLLSHELMKNKVVPLLSEQKPVFFILIDNLRFDQWKVFEPLLSEYYNVASEDAYYSILPTTTAYARNAIFSGETPLQMSKKYPELWSYDDEEGGKNNHENEFFEKFKQVNNLKIKHAYHKILNQEKGKQVLDSFSTLMGNDLNLLVYNFVDMLSHARTDMQVIKELAADEAAYRSLSLSWFKNSSLLALLQKLAAEEVKVVITTDHGTIRVKKPYKIAGEKSTNTNLRYKTGRNLGYEPKGVFDTSKPEQFQLPRRNVSSSYVFATEDDFFAYPNNYNHYVSHYKDTFQHGGVSLEEVIIPFIVLDPK